MRRQQIQSSILVACLWLIVMSVGPAQAQTEIIEKYNQAITAPTREKIVLLREVVRSAPNFLEARYALGATYYEQENFKAAVVHFEYILARPDEIEKKPTIKNIVTNGNLPQLVAAAYNAISSQYLEVNPDSAVIVLKRAIELDDAKAIFHYNLGIAYLKLEKYKEARASLLESLQKDESYSLSWFNLGTTYWYLSDYERAVDSYKQGLALDPDNQSGRQNLQKALDKIRVQSLFKSADSALAAQNPDLAIKLYNEIQAIDPADHSAADKKKQANQLIKYLQAKSLHDKGRWTEVQKLLDELPSGYRDTSVLAASVREKLSSEQSQRALDQDIRSAQTLMNQGNFAAAHQRTDALLRSHPNHPILRTLSASIDSAIAASEAAQQAQRKAQSNEQTLLENEQQQAENSGADSTPAQIDSPSTTVEITKTEPSDPQRGFNRPVEGEHGSAQTAFSNRTMMFVIAGIAVFFIALILILKRKRPSGTAVIASESSKEQDHHGDESVFVKAAVEKVDFNEINKEKASSSDASHQRFFEDLVDDQLISNDPLSESGTVEIHEIAEAKPAEKNPEDANEDQTTPAGVESSDGDTFLSIIQAEQLAEDESERDSRTDTGSIDATRTVDMAQFKTRKIGRYNIEKEIGRGAAGRIYKAWDPKLDRTVVIKTVSYSLTASDDEIRRLKARVYREARAAAKLNHPNIVVVYDVEDEPTFSYIVMEHIEGMDLRELLLKETKISPERTFNILSQVCKALQFSHGAGIIHRDIKPSNILIVKKDKVKVTDFGIAKVSNHLTLTQTGRVVGTPSYMAPEQIEGADVDGRADIFSLGVVFYELLTGQRPFAGESLAALAYKIVHVEPTPPSLVNLELNDVCDEMVSRAIAKDPSDRYQSINDFLKDLQRAQTQLASSK